MTTSILPLVAIAIVVTAVVLAIRAGLHKTGAASYATNRG